MGEAAPGSKWRITCRIKGCGSDDQNASGAHCTQPGSGSTGVLRWGRRQELNRNGRQGLTKDTKTAARFGHRLLPLKWTATLLPEYSLVAAPANVMRKTLSPLCSMTSPPSTVAI